jgi:opacity protein-like surface antigen
MKVMKRKVSLWVVLCLLFASTKIYSQEKTHTFEVGIGLWNTNEIINTFSNMIVSSLPDNIKMEDDNSYGSIHLGYKYNLTNRFALGGFMAFDYVKSKGFFEGNEAGIFHKRHYTLAIEVEYAYIRFEIFTMYGLAGIGGTLYTLKYEDHNNSNQDDSNTNPYVTFQVIPIGLRFGKNVGGFLEFGFGYRGIVNAGMFVKF